MKKVHQVTGEQRLLAALAHTNSCFSSPLPTFPAVSQPKRALGTVRSPKDLTSESSMSRLLFCCWFPWMLRAEMRS